MNRSDTQSMSHDPDISKIELSPTTGPDPSTTALSEIDRIHDLADNLEKISGASSDQHSASLNARMFAHEVNNLIFGISGQAQRAMISGSKDHERAALQVAAHAGARVAGLCDLFLRSSTATPDNLCRTPVLKRSQVLNSAIFTESCLVNHPAVVGGSVRFESDLEPIAWVHSTELLLGQVLLNLYTNALSAIRRNAEDDQSLEGVVRLKWESLDDGGCALSVEDSGSGFDNTPNIADTSASEPDGYGLGLGICRTIVEGFGGRVEIGASDELGGGKVSLVFGQRTD